MKLSDLIKKVLWIYPQRTRSFLHLFLLLLLSYAINGPIAAQNIGILNKQDCGESKILIGDECISSQEIVNKLELYFGFSRSDSTVDIESLLLSRSYYIGENELTDSIIGRNSEEGGNRNGTKGKKNPQFSDFGMIYDIRKRGILETVPEFIRTYDLAVRNVRYEVLEKKAVAAIVEDKGSSVSTVSRVRISLVRDQIGDWKIFNVNLLPSHEEVQDYEGHWNLTPRIPSDNCIGFTDAVSIPFLN